MRVLIIFCLFIVLSGCATAYKRDGFTGGFSETQLGENVWRVTFIGNGYTHKHRAEDFALLRSAELTLANGYTHFFLTDSNSSTQTSAFTTPSTSYTTGNAYRSGNYIHGSARTQTYGGQNIVVSRPSTTNAVVMFLGKPEIQGMVYDARFICSTLGKKYDVACGTNASTVR